MHLQMVVFPYCHVSFRGSKPLGKPWNRNQHFTCWAVSLRECTKKCKCKNCLRMFEKQYYTYDPLTSQDFLGAWVLLSTYFDFFMTLPQLTSGSKNLGSNLYKVFLLGAKKRKTRWNLAKTQPPENAPTAGPKQNAHFPKFEISWLPGTVSP